MTVTAEQLDELERLGKSNPDRDFVLSGPLTLQLVAIARAALAWSEARDAVRLLADEVATSYPDPVTVEHEIEREKLGGIVKARAVALEVALCRSDPRRES